jgi:hypothetical protein
MASVAGPVFTMLATGTTPNERFSERPIGKPV